MFDEFFSYFDEVTDKFSDAVERLMINKSDLNDFLFFLFEMINRLNDDDVKYFIPLTEYIVDNFSEESFDAYRVYRFIELAEMVSSKIEKYYYGQFNSRIYIYEIKKLNIDFNNLEKISINSKHLSKGSIIHDEYIKYLFLLYKFIWDNLDNKNINYFVEYIVSTTKHLTKNEPTDVTYNLLGYILDNRKQTVSLLKVL